MKRTDGKRPPLDWTPGTGERATKIDAVITELARQAYTDDFRSYRRDQVEKAVKAMADVSSPGTVNDYVDDIARSGAFDINLGKFKVTSHAITRIKTEYYGDE